MQDPNRKVRMISLRLSETEYEALHALYANHGARNVSDFARLALQRVISNTVSTDGALVAKVQQLDDRLRSLEARVALCLEERAKVMT